MTTEQSDALKLADQLRDMSTKFKTPSHERGVCNGAIEKLRRLHEVNQELLEALQDFSAYVHSEQSATDGAVQYSNTQIHRLVFNARAAIAKATGGQP